MDLRAPTRLTQSPLPDTNKMPLLGWWQWTPALVPFSKDWKSKGGSGMGMRMGAADTLSALQGTWTKTNPKLSLM